MSDVTTLLKRIAQDDRAAIDELFNLLYDDLYRMARARLAGNRPITDLNATSLAHEAYLRLREVEHINAEDRGRFLSYVSKVLRSIIVDFARRRNAERRGGHQVRITLNTAVGEALPNAFADVESINDALLQLEVIDPRLKCVVEMRYFGGLSDAEIAEALGVSERTVNRDWERARLLLAVALRR